MKLLTLAAVAALSAGLSAQQLNGLFASNNGGAPGGAVYFDLSATADINVLEFDLNTSAIGVTGTFQLFTLRGGSYVGNQANPGLWTQEATGMSTAPTLGPDMPSPFALDLPLAIANGETLGVAIVFDTTLDHNYTNGTGTNQNFDDGTLFLAAGSGSNAAFTTPIFDPRVVNCNIRYAPAMGTLASTTSIGSGCGADPNPSTFAELFAGGTLDYAAGTGYTLIWDGTGYCFSNGASAIVAPTGAGPLTLGDDQTVPVTLPAAIPTEVGMITDVFVCSNGYIALESTTVADFSPSLGELFSRFAVVCPLWTDLDPTAGGTIDAEADGAGVFHVTWTGCVDWGTTNPNTFQCSIHPNGDIEVKFDATSQGGTAISGYSPGNSILTPTSNDLSAIAGVAKLGTGRGDISLSTSGRPVLGTAITYDLSGLAGPGPNVGAVLFGTPLAVPAPLDFFSLVGCNLYLDLVIEVVPATGMGDMSSTVALPIPLDPNLIGNSLPAQGADINSAYNVLGVAVSQRLDANFGDV